MDQPHRAGMDAVLRSVPPLHRLLTRINAYLVRWLRNKFKRLKPFKKAKAAWQRVTRQYPKAFAHWAWATTF
jgi:RNA-directed DNA polymerase